MGIDVEPSPPLPSLPLIDLARGYPTRSLLPVEEFRTAIADTRGERAVDMLAYGPGTGPESVRRDLAAFLSARYRWPVTSDELLLGHGNSLNLSLTCQLFSQADDVVVSGDPTYFHAAHIFSTSRLQVHAIPVDADGMRVEMLERELKDGLRPKLVYCIPSFHNPTGVDLAADRAERLIELADTYDFLVVADEPYTLLHFGEAPPACMMSYDRGRARVISLGSFTKILAPGLRAGWIHAHPSVIERFARHGALRSGGSLNPVAFAVVEHTLKSGFLSANIDRLRDVYGARAQVMTDAIRTHMDHVKFHVPRGGYFVWLELKSTQDCAQVLPHARERGVLFTLGTRCTVAMDAAHCMRLCFAYQESHNIEAGIQRLASAVRDNGV